MYKRKLLMFVLPLLLVVLVALAVLAFVDKQGKISAEKISITNVTDTGATITWKTVEKTEGKVYFREKSGGTWSSLPLVSIAGKSASFDDRDVDQDKNGDWVLKSGKNGGSKKRLTHSVTLRNLEPETEYEYRIGTAVGTVKVDKDNKAFPALKTGKSTEELSTPDPVYSKVLNLDVTKANPVDGIVYYRLLNPGALQVTSALYSTTLSDQSSWSGDLSGMVTANGDKFIRTKDTIIVLAVETEIGDKTVSYALQDYKPLPNLFIDTSNAQGVSLKFFSSKLTGSSSLLSRVSASEADGCGASACEAGRVCYGEGYVAENTSVATGNDVGTYKCIAGNWVFASEYVSPVNTDYGPVCLDTTLKDCEETYQESCMVGVKLGYHMCHKKGQSPCGRIGPTCSWDATKSSCGDCIPDKREVNSAIAEAEQEALETSAVTTNEQACANKYLLSPSSYEIPTGTTCPEGDSDGGFITIGESVDKKSHKCCVKPITVPVQPAGGGNEYQGAWGGGNDAEKCESEGPIRKNCVFCSDGLALKYDNSCNRITMDINGDGSPDTCDSSAHSATKECPVGQATGTPLTFYSGTGQRCTVAGYEGYFTANCEYCSNNADKYILNSSVDGTCGEHQVTTPYQKCTTYEDKLRTLQNGYCRYGNLGQMPNLVNHVLAESTSTTSLSATETGRYAFFKDGQRVAEKNIVVVNGKATIKLYVDTNKNGKKDASESFITDYASYSLSKEAAVVSININTGWNLINIPLVDTGKTGAVTSAGELLDAWNKEGEDDGVAIKHVARYRDGQFQLYTKREDSTEYANDFDLIPGEALFVFNTGTSSKVTFGGNSFTESVGLDLTNGWNMIGVIAPGKTLTSENVIDGIIKAGMTADTCTQYDSGLYQSVIKENGVLYGNNFNIVDTKGYFVKVKSGGGQTYTP